MTSKDKAAASKVSDPAQESRELLVWGAIPAVVGGAGLIVDAIYIGSQAAAAIPALGSAFNGGYDPAFIVTVAASNPAVLPMVVGGIITLVLLALSRFGQKRVSTIGSLSLIVFGVVVLGYLLYTVINPSFASIYSLVMVLLAICLFVAGASGLLARRVIVVK